jgi:hypothetical protein
MLLHKEVENYIKNMYMYKKCLIILHITGILHFQEISFALLTWVYNFLHEELE